MNAVDFTKQLHDTKVCFLTTLVILCISARIGLHWCANLCQYSGHFRMPWQCLSKARTTCPSVWLENIRYLSRTSVGALEPSLFVLSQSLATALWTLIRFCMHPLSASLMWCFLVGLGMGWDNVDVTSLGVRCFPALYQPCRFCLLGVWISWFVGVGWTFLFPQRVRCGLDHKYLSVGIRSKPAKLISGHHYFIASRYRRTTSCTFQRCNRCFQFKPFFCEHPISKNRNLHCFGKNDSFLHRHLFPLRWVRARARRHLPFLKVKTARARGPILSLGLSMGVLVTSLSFLMNFWVASRKV